MPGLLSGGKETRGRTRKGGEPSCYLVNADLGLAFRFRTAGTQWAFARSPEDGMKQKGSLQGHRHRTDFASRYLACCGGSFQPYESSRKIDTADEPSRDTNRRLAESDS
jgi:hypothetical protein